MFAYIFGFMRSLFGHGFLWWWSLIITYILGTGFFADYEDFRIKINSWQSWYVMPEEFPFWWIAIPLLGWIIGRVAHDEGMKQLKRARLIFDDPYIKRDVPLNERYIEIVPMNMGPSAPTIAVQQQINRSVGTNDIASISVRNCPYDMENGRPVQDAYVVVTVFDRQSHKKIREFDYPRWTENPKPGYDENPKEHFPTEWNFRTLHPDMRRNVIDFALKSIDEENAYGFIGRSQLERNWKDTDLEIKPGEYLVRLCIFGFGLRKAPAEIWVILENPGKDKAMNVCRTKERTVSGWFSNGSR